MKKPYSIIDDPDLRPNVGIMLINNNHQVLAGEVNHNPGEWMMPQGGIDSGETPLQAMQRELFEETSINFTDTRLIREHNEWLSYQFRNPLERDGGVYIGQRQKWFLLEYNGIPLDATLTKDQEFRYFEWVDPGWLMRHTTKFKFELYKDIFVAFRHYFP